MTWARQCRHLLGLAKLAVGSFPGVSYSVSLANCLVLDFAPEHVRFDFLNERVDCQWAQLGGCRKVCDETVGGPWPTGRDQERHEESVLTVLP